MKLISPIKILVLAIVIKQIFLSLFIPIFEGPDEQAHFATIQFLSEFRRLPQGKEFDLSTEMTDAETFLGTYRDQRGINSFTYHPEYRHQYSNNFYGPFEKKIISLNTTDSRKFVVKSEAARYPLLYYFYSSIFYFLTFFQNLFSRLFTIRLANVIFPLVIALSTYFMALKITTRSVAIIVAMITSLHPMLSFLTSTINSDNLHIALSTIFLTLCIYVLNTNWTTKLSLLIGTTIGLDLLTKPQGYILIALLGLLIIFKLNHPKNTLKQATIVSLIILSLVSLQEYPKVLALIANKNPFLPPPITNVNPPSLSEFTKYSINLLYTQNIIWYWGVFKWLGVVLPRPLWWITNRLVLIAAFGIIFQIIKSLLRHQFKPPTLSLIFLSLSSLIYILAIFIFDYQHAQVFGYSFGVQGRYYLPMISAHMLLLTLGLINLFPQKFHKFVLIILSSWFLILQSGLIYTLTTSYYQTDSFHNFITQVSQYKPLFIKGYFWYIYLSFPIISLILYSKLNYRIFTHAPKNH